MFKLILLTLACVLATACSAASFGKSNVAYLKQLKSIESSTRAISMYYTPFTDATFASNDAMKKAAIYTIRINCFLNCKMYMEKIIDQFSRATSVVCPSMMGSRYLLIEFSGKGFKVDINYLKWGNIVVFDGNCFYNKKSIDDVVPAIRTFDDLLGKSSKKHVERE